MSTRRVNAACLLLLLAAGCCCLCAGVGLASASDVLGACLPIGNELFHEESGRMLNNPACTHDNVQDSQIWYCADTMHTSPVPTTGTSSVDMSVVISEGHGEGDDWDNFNLLTLEEEGFAYVVAMHSHLPNDTLVLIGLATVNGALDVVSWVVDRGPAGAWTQYVISASAHPEPSSIDPITDPIELASTYNDRAIVVVWASLPGTSTSPKLLASRSNDGGATWTSPVQVTNNGGIIDEGNPALASTPHCEITTGCGHTESFIIAFIQDGFLFTASSANGLNWGAAQRVTASPEPEMFPSIAAVDSLGNWLLVFSASVMGIPISNWYTVGPVKVPPSATTFPDPELLSPYSSCGPITPATVASGTHYNDLSCAFASHIIITLDGNIALAAFGFHEFGTTGSTGIDYHIATAKYSELAGGFGITSVVSTVDNVEFHAKPAVAFGSTHEENHFYVSAGHPQQISGTWTSGGTSELEFGAVYKLCPVDVAYFPDAPVCPCIASNDGDLDGVCDEDDACEGHNDAEDDDGDSVPNGCDVCDGENDLLDADGDGTPDCADVCPDDNPNDTDGDGVCDSDDVCEGHDDSEDADSDGMPDECDECVTDSSKTEPGVCGCAVVDTDADSDGFCDSNGDDACPTDQNKQAAGLCGCGSVDVDGDDDGFCDTNDDDTCPEDFNKQAPGVCGCGVVEADGDSDGSCDSDGSDQCPLDPLKTEPGSCGCNTPDIDANSDGKCDDVCTPDADSDGYCDSNGADACPSDASKSVPGICGCGVAEEDVDSDGFCDSDGSDACTDDASKHELGLCGCGFPETDIDSDGVCGSNGDDQCDEDATKIAPGVCGCGEPEDTGDYDLDGDPNCLDPCPVDNPNYVDSLSTVCACEAAGTCNDLVTTSSTSSTTSGGVSSSATSAAGDDGGGGGSAALVASVVGGIGAAAACVVCFGALLMRRRRTQNADDIEEDSIEMKRRSANLMMGVGGGSVGAGGGGSGGGATGQQQHPSMYTSEYSYSDFQPEPFDAQMTAAAAGGGRKGAYSRDESFDDAAAVGLISSAIYAAAPAPRGNSGGGGGSGSGSGMLVDEAVVRSSEGPAALLQSSTRSWFIDSNEIEFGKKLGSGSFGVVFAGKWRRSKVAIKKINAQIENDGASAIAEDFAKEAELMSKLRPNPNVVLFLGVSVLPDQSMAIVAEFMPGGSLEERLHDVNAMVTLRVIVAWAAQIAAGMQHLESENVVHRDLASRNVLLDDVGMHAQCKITDFGMSRVVDPTQIYNKTQTTVGPLIWMAPEAMKELKYSSKSDVWSFAVTLLEMLLRGKPYENMGPLQVSLAVVQGHLSPKDRTPEHAPPEIHDIIERASSYDPRGRPTFREIYTQLKALEARFVPAPQ